MPDPPTTSDIELLGQDGEPMADQVLAQLPMVEQMMEMMPQEMRNVFWKGIREVFHQKFLKERSVVDLNEAIKAGEKALTSAPDEDRASDLNSLAYMMVSKYEISSDLSHLNQAISYSLEAKEHALTMDELRWEIINDLGFAYNLRYQSLPPGRGMDDLDRAIDCSREVLAHTQPGSPVHATAVSNLASRLLLRSGANDSLDDRNEALEAARQCLEIECGGSVPRIVMQQNLSYTLLMDYKRTGHGRDLEEALRLQRLVVDTCTNDDEHMAKNYNTLADIFHEKYRQTLDSSDLTESLLSRKKAILASPLSDDIDSTRGRYLLHYVIQVKELVALINDAAKIEDLILEAKELIESMPDVFAEFVSVRYQFGHLLSRKYELTGEIIDLNILLCHTKAVAYLINCMECESSNLPKHDMDALLLLLTHVQAISAASHSDDIVVQMTATMHKAYCTLIKTKDYIESLTALELDTQLHVQIRIVVQSLDPTDEERMIRMRERVDFASSLGAKSFQFRLALGNLKLKDHEASNITSEMEALEKDFGNLTTLKPSGDMPQENEDNILEVAEEVYNVARSTENFDQGVLELQTLYSNQLTKENKAHLVDLIANLHFQSYLFTGSPEDLMKAVDNVKKSLQLFDDQVYSNQEWNMLRGNVLCDTANALRGLFIQMRTEESLTDVLSMAEATVKMTEYTYAKPRTAEEYGLRSAAKTIISNALKAKYQLRGDFKDLEEAIKAMHEAMEIDDQSPSVSTEQKEVQVNQLALMMRLRFFETHETYDLDTGIRYIKDFVEGYGGKRPDHLRNYNGLICNLGLLCGTKAERTGDLDDVDQAIKYLNKALDLTPTESPAYYAAMQNLANTYSTRYGLFDELGDLEIAVGYAKILGGRAYEAPVSDGNMLLESAMIMRTSYKATNNIEHLKLASHWARKAMPYFPPSSHTYPYAQLGHATILELQFNNDHSDQTLTECVEAYKAATEAISARWRDKDLATQALYKLLVKQNNWVEALKLVEGMIEGMGDRCPRWLPSGDRQFVLSIFHGVPSDTAALLLQLSSPNRAYRALRALEIGRGILLGSTMDYRSEIKHFRAEQRDLLRDWNNLCMRMDSAVQESKKELDMSKRHWIRAALSKTIERIRAIPKFQNFSPLLDYNSPLLRELRSENPELFGVYNTLQRQHDALPIEIQDGQQSKRQRQLSKEMDQMLTLIRKQPGLEDFLLPLSEAEMKVLGSQGPVVIINSSENIQRSDAIIITANGIQALPLSTLTYSDAKRYAQLHAEAVTGWTVRTMARKNKLMREYLLWLWSEAVQPVLNNLGIQASRAEPKQRIHWIGIGVFSGAPFHAAGDHSEGSTENTIACVMSSYIPNLRALSFAREEPSSKDLRSLSSAKRFLLVSVAEAPGVPRLPAVHEEATAIAGVAQSHYNVVHLKEPTTEEVLQELPLANILHLACHATADRHDMSNSHLILMPEKEASPTSLMSPELVRHMGEDASKYYQPEAAYGQLSVSQISSKRAPSAELAFLSACSAAENRVVALADESVHIASAFQLAGFRHVIGTLWQTKDKCCREVAGHFYQVLLAEGDGLNLRVPEALDKAVLKLREANPEKVLDWAPFIHMGA